MGDLVEPKIEIEPKIESYFTVAIVAAADELIKKLEDAMLKIWPEKFEELHAEEPIIWEI